MALHSKVERLMELRPDIAIIPESARPEIVKKKNKQFNYFDACWIGYNDHKGLGVYSFTDLKLNIDTSYNPQFELFVPLEVSGNGYNFNLIGVWAFNYRPKNSQMKDHASTQFVLRHYKKFIKKQPTIIVGDFNNNVIWDKTGKENNFQSAADSLKQLNLVSVYHSKEKIDFGKELHPTLIWRKNPETTYHIDYCFAPDDCISDKLNVEIGSPGNWLSDSDHVPLIVDIEL